MAALTLPSTASNLLTRFGEKALKVAENSKDPGLGFLATSLLTFATFDIGEESNENLEHLLQEVENFLSNPSAPVNKRPTGYIALQEFAKVTWLSDYKLNKTIKSCWKKKRERHEKTIHHLIQNCSQLEKRQSEYTVGDSITEFPNPIEYPYHLNSSLYKVLGEHVACTCQSGQTNKSATFYHKPKLRLYPGFYEAANYKNYVQIDMMFSRLPVTSFATEIDWRGIQILSPSKYKAKKTTRFLQSPSGVHVDTPNQIESDDTLEVVEKGEMCRKLAASETDSCLHFKISHHQLKYSRYEQVKDRQVLKELGYNLGEVLETHSMKPRLRLVLGYIIAKSVWQYYNSDWMNTVWTHHNIHFMQEISEEGTGAVFCKPYLSVEFQDTEVGPLECRRPKSPPRRLVGSIFHKYPIILGLGIMLLEIGTGKCLQSSRPTQWDALTINSLYAIGIKAFNDATATNSWASGCDFPDYRQAVEKCFLAHELFQDAHFDMKQPNVNFEKRRSILYNEVVHPLELLLKNTKWSQDLEPYIEQIPFQRTTSSPISKEKKPELVATSHSRPTHRADFQVAIICALKVEYEAVLYLFDEFWDNNGDAYGRAEGDRNTYRTGRIGKYNIVLTLLPRMGKVNAASTAANMHSSYSKLQLVLLVGICGGVPHSQDKEVFLGDIIISNRILEYDFGRKYPDGFVPKMASPDSLHPPGKEILSLLTIFETNDSLAWLAQRSAKHLQQLQVKASQRGYCGKYDYLGMENDRLYQATYRHKHHNLTSCICHDWSENDDPVCHEATHSSCKDLGCSDGYLIPRSRPQTLQESNNGDKNMNQQLTVHVGAVASGDTVMKSADDRDRIAKESNVIAFEMESAGIWDALPCIMVKGVCDYADSHKDKRWQNFAAATAAATAAAILERSIQTDQPQ